MNFSGFHSRSVLPLYAYTQSRQGVSLHVRSDGFYSNLNGGIGGYTDALDLEGCIDATEENRIEN